MKIRTQNLMTIVPIFLLMAVIIGVMTISRQKQEIEWGLQEKIKALTQTTAELVAPEMIQKILDNPGNDRLVTALTDHFQHIHRRGNNHIIRFYLLDKNASQIVVVYPDTIQNKDRQSWLSTRKNLPNWPSDLMLLANGKTTLVMSNPSLSFVRHQPMIAFTAIMTSDHNVLALLGCEMSTEFLIQRQYQIVLKLILLFGLMIIAGILAALFIAKMVTTTIRQMTHAAAAVVAAGQSTREMAVSSIYEVSELSNTFYTMSSVLNDVLTKTRRALIEGEQFRTSHHLAAYFRRNLVKPFHGNYNNLQVSASIFTMKNSPDYLDIFTLRGISYAIYGRLKKEDDLAAVTLSTALCTLVRQLMENAPPENVYNTIRHLYPIDEWHCLAWQFDPQIIRHYFLSDTGNLLNEFVEIQPKKLLIFHTLSDYNTEQLTVFQKMYQTLSPLDFHRDMKNVLHDDGFGSIIILQKDH